MIVCSVCKTENEDHFSFCKNCGLTLKDEAAKPPVKPMLSVDAPTYNEQQPSFVKAPVNEEKLVPVYMMLPDILDPTKRSLQKVYVTALQYEAMKKAGMFEKR